VITVKLLQAARLSRLGDASTGLDKQDEAARRYADAYSYLIVDTAADTNVSGDSDPFARPELGPWLTRPELAEKYDGIIAATLDRLARNSRYLTKLKDWAAEHGKQIIVISPALRWPIEPDDLGSKIMWEIFGILAEYELDMIKRRSAETRTKLLGDNKLVGRPPWGFLVVDAPGGHKTLAPDPQLALYVRALADRYLAGDSLLALARWLDAEGIPPMHGGRWNPGSVSQVLRNPALVGRRKNADGQTVLTFEGILDPAIWDRLQRKMAANSDRRGKVRSDPAMLTGVLYCALCGRIMHRREVTSKRKGGGRYVWHGYRCDGTAKDPSTCRNMIPRAEVEDWVNEGMSGPMYADLEVIERVTIPSHGHEAELALIEQDIRSLDLDAPDFLDRQAALLAERRRLLALPAEPERTEDRPLGVTVAEHWPTLTDAEKRAYLLAAGAKVYAANPERMAEAAFAARPDAPEVSIGWYMDVAEPNVLRVA
jgi:DNA invertase Pin-like site-specific DNA recombinase